MQLQKTESSFKPKFKESTRELIIRKLTERHPQPEKAQAIADSVDNYLNSGCKITEQTLDQLRLKVDDKFAKLPHLDYHRRPIIDDSAFSNIRTRAGSIQHGTDLQALDEKSTISKHTDLRSTQNPRKSILDISEHSNLKYVQKDLSKLPKKEQQTALRDFYMQQMKETQQREVKERNVAQRLVMSLVTSDNAMK